jgi:hypothetical protein
MSEEELRQFQEKGADIVKNYADLPEIPEPEIPESDKYEHEMILPETKAMRAMRFGLGFIYIIFVTYVVVFYIIHIAIPRYKEPGFFITSCFIFFVLSSLMYFAVKGTFVYRYKIKLAITEKELLIRSPMFGAGAGPDPIKLEIPIREIVDVSIRNARSPELKSIMKDDKTFKLPVNRNLSLGYLLHRSRYKYLLSLGGQPVSGRKYVDLELQGEWRILVEFDDVENFVSVLKRRISQMKASLGCITQNDSHHTC